MSEKVRITNMLSKYEVPGMRIGWGPRNRWDPRCSHCNGDRQTPGGHNGGGPRNYRAAGRQA